VDVIVEIRQRIAVGEHTVYSVESLGEPLHCGADLQPDGRSKRFQHRRISDELDGIAEALLAT
jgi:hypothetical protein